MAKNRKYASAGISSRLRQPSAKICAVAMLLCLALALLSACAGIPVSHAGAADNSKTSPRIETATPTPEDVIDGGQEKIPNILSEDTTDTDVENTSVPQPEDPPPTETPPPSAETPAASGSDDAPGSVSGIHYDWTITMSLCVTEMDWSSIYSYKAAHIFKNGFVLLRRAAQGMPSGGYVFMDKSGRILDMENCKIALSFDAGGHALVQRADDTWVYMDTNGEMMDAGSYKDARFELFSAVDYALAQRADDTWVHMDANGEIRVPSDQRELYAKPAADFEHADERADARMFGEPGAYYYQLFDMNGKLLNDTKFQVIGRFYRGLALIVQDRKVGLIDAKGNVVIAPVFPYDETGYEIDENKFHRYAPYYMKDDAIVIPYNGKVALLIITRA